MTTRYEYYLRQCKMSEFNENILKGVDVEQNERLLVYYKRLQADTLEKRDCREEHLAVVSVEFDKYKEVIDTPHISFKIKFDLWGEVVDEIVEEYSVLDYGFGEIKEAILSKGSSTIYNLSDSSGEYRGIFYKKILNVMEDSIQTTFF